MFWFEDIYQNKELLPTADVVRCRSTASRARVEKVRRVTVRYSFPEPYYLLPDMLAGVNAPSAGSRSRPGRSWARYAPAHYLKQFHPKYVSKEELDKRSRRPSSTTGSPCSRSRTTGRSTPTCRSSRPGRRSRRSTPRPGRWSGTRTASGWTPTGNQLPYIDKIQITLAENLEVLNLRAIAGEYDMQERHIDIAKLPVLLRESAEGQLQAVASIPLTTAATCASRFNMSYDGRPRDRQVVPERRLPAGALAGHRPRPDQRDVLARDRARPARWCPPRRTSTAPAQSTGTLWARHDPTQANELLDKLGLDKKDAEGYRLRSDGKGRLRLEVTTYGGQFIQFTQISEMIRDQWKADRHRPAASTRSSGAWAEPDASPTSCSSSPGATTAASTCSPSPRRFPCNGTVQRGWAGLRQVVPVGWRAGEGAAAADARR